jgi:dihydroorotate dehydrogenase
MPIAPPTLPVPAYDITRSYEDNYHEGPFIADAPPPRTDVKRERFLGFDVRSKIGIAAGPLLNARWVAAYAQMGFDLPIYKTVRTRSWPSHPPPNCVFLEREAPLEEADFGKPLRATKESPQRIDQISITNSFGMPSRDPSLWQADVAVARQSLGAGQILIVSVVGTPDETGPDGLADDYARGARQAVEAGADAVEINLSCPNVVSKEGSVFCDPAFSSQISRAVKRAISPVPLIIKIGYIADLSRLAQVVAANAPHIQAVSAINTLSFEVFQSSGDMPALPGRVRSGVCGAAIRPCAMAQAQRTVDLVRREKYDLAVIGVGGVMTPDHIRDYFNLGVDAVMSATGAMWDPLLAHKYLSATTAPK